MKKYFFLPLAQTKGGYGFGRNSALLRFILLAILTLQILPQGVAAQSNQAVFLFSPNTGSFSLNDTIPVDLRINSTNSTGITSVKAYLTFDASKLEVISLDFSQSSFGFQWEKAFDNTKGTISIQPSSSTPRLGNHLITKITFRAKSTGAATVGYDPNCFAQNNPTCLALKPDDTNILVASVGASFTITSSSSQPTPTSSPAPTSLPSSESSAGGGGGGGGSSGGGGGGGGGGSSSGGGGGGGSSPAGADLNRDGRVNIFDLSILLRNWNKSGQGDLNGDGKVNIFDLSILLRSWSK